MTTITDPDTLLHCSIYNHTSKKNSMKVLINNLYGARGLHGQPGTSGIRQEEIDNKFKLQEYFFKEFNITIEDLQKEGRAEAIIRELEIKKLLNKD